ncbi:hypothetical protein [Phaeobacter sp.]|uniref:hypothetical protein n=1 Tax=Phaeobacter sp. TaxID=1902409 RepID=UPI0025DB1C2C|nr:hypothetical protein [Phaeobacter sp.]
MTSITQTARMAGAPLAAPYSPVTSGAAHASTSDIGDPNRAPVQPGRIPPHSTIGALSNSVSDWSVQHAERAAKGEFAPVDAQLQKPQSTAQQVPQMSAQDALRQIETRAITASLFQDRLTFM